jgi:hypothetical protein
MRFFLSFIFLIAFCLTMNAQSGPGDYAPIVKKQAEDMAQALIKKDYKTYLKYMHPKDIASLGGEAAAEDTLRMAEAAMKKYESFISYIQVSDPSWVIDTAGELQCTVPETVVLNVKGGRVRSELTFVGISKNKGKNWIFIDTSADFKHLKKNYPTLSSQLNIPYPTRPVFEQN